MDTGPPEREHRTPFFSRSWCIVFALWCVLCVGLAWWAITPIAQHLVQRRAFVWATVHSPPGIASVSATITDAQGQRSQADLFNTGIETDRLFAISITRVAIHPTWHGEPIPPREITLQAATANNGVLDIVGAARSTGAWREGAAVEWLLGTPVELPPDQAAPLKLFWRAKWIVLRFTSGPDQGVVEVRDGAVSRIVDLHAPVEGVVDVPLGAEPFVHMLHVPQSTLPLTIRLRTTLHDQPVRIMDAHADGGILRAVDLDTLEWSPAPPDVQGARRICAWVCVGMIGFAVLHRAARLRRDATSRTLALITVWSAGLAGLLMLAFWPGLSITDTGSRALAAHTLATAWPVPAWVYSHWFPPGMSLLLSASLRWTGDFGVATFVGAWWFFASLGWVLALAMGPRAGPRWAPLAWMLVALLPPIWQHAIAILPDPWTSAALCTVASVILWRARKDLAAPRWLEGVATGLFMLACVVLFTLRANSITVAPVLIACVLWLSRPWHRAVLACAWIIACCVLAGRLQVWLPWRRDDTLAGTLIWEYTGMLRLADQPTRERFMPMELVNTPGRAPMSPAQASAMAISAHDWLTHDELIWGRTPFDTSEVVRRGGTTRERFLSFVRTEPWLYARTKWEVWKTMLGLRRPALLQVLNGWAPTWTLPFGVDTRMKPALGSLGNELLVWFEARQRWFAPLGVPLLWMGAPIVLICGAAARWRGVKAFVATPLVAPTAVLLLGLAYYGGFFVVTPGFHYRYFLPAQVLLIVATLGLIAALRDARAAPRVP